MKQVFADNKPIAEVVIGNRGVVMVCRALRVGTGTVELGYIVHRQKEGEKEGAGSWWFYGDTDCQQPEDIGQSVWFRHLPFLPGPDEDRIRAVLEDVIKDYRDRNVSR